MLYDIPTLWDTIISHCSSVKNKSNTGGNGGFAKGYLILGNGYWVF